MTNREKYPSVDDRALAFLKSKEFLSLKEILPYELVSMAFAWEHLKSCSCVLNGKIFIERNGKRYELVRPKKRKRDCVKTCSFEKDGCQHKCNLPLWFTNLSKADSWLKGIK